MRSLHFIRQRPIKKTKSAILDGIFQQHLTHVRTISVTPRSPPKTPNNPSFDAAVYGSDGQIRVE